MNYQTQKILLTGNIDGGGQADKIVFDQEDAIVAIASAMLTNDLDPNNNKGARLTDFDANFEAIADFTFWGIRQGTQEKFIETTDVFPENQWVHVAATVDDSGNGKIYWNGELKAEGVVNVPTTMSRDNRYIGKSNWDHDDHFRGKIDEVRIWNKARNQEEILQKLQTKLQGNETDLVGYWTFDDDNNGVVTDLTGNGNNGTMQGGALVFYLEG